jgi:hypothetical protein
VSALRALRGVAGAPPVEVPETCELCGGLVAETHAHVADTEDRRLLCVCRACSLLFAHRGAGGRYRLVAGDVRRLSLTLDAALWHALDVPVGLVFLLRHASGEVEAFYPGAAGPVSATVPTGAWGALVAADPSLADLVPEVEALLVRRGVRGSPDSVFVVPVDRCYELVGLVRGWWSGTTGGDAVWDGVAQWFASLEGP